MIVWLKQGEGFSNSWILSTLKLRLNDISKQDVMATIWTNSVCLNYRIFKEDCLFERYLALLSKKDRITLSRFRCTSHRLPINNNRFKEAVNEISIECPCCDMHESGDEFHYVFVCPFFRKERELYLGRKVIVKRLCTSHMFNLFLCSGIGQLKKLVLFLRIIMSYFADLYTCKSEQSNHMSPIKRNVTTRSGRLIKQPTILDL